MGFSVFHQLGHMSRWNFESYLEDNIGSGFILSPKSMNYDDVLNLPNEIKEKSLFDPQFFKPNYQAKKLASYPFFPSRIANGFDTQEFMIEKCDECAKLCLEFQIDNNFAKVIIPTRHLNRTPPNFFEEQSKLFVDPFVNELEKKQTHNQVLLQVIVNDSMIKDSDFTDDLLNWITRYQKIDGVYLIADIHSRKKQIADVEFLKSYIDFIKRLRANDLYVLLGYVNTEAIVLSLADPNAMTIGSYENVRMFNISNFEFSEPAPRNPPLPRIYVGKLMQFVNHTYKQMLLDKLGKDFFDQNKYQATMFVPTFRWHFQKPELYKHFFLVFGRQLENISQIDVGDRPKVLEGLLDVAIDTFEKIEDQDILLDTESQGYHLDPWRTVVGNFLV